jgi:hypothetical protein
MPPPANPRFTDKNLYGPGGPVAADVKQDALGDCYFVATLASVARQRPDHIKNTIAYDKFSHHFVVRLFDMAGKIKYIHVTQAELVDNIARQGGSRMDNTGRDERTWPAVFETAYAKMFDTTPKDGLAEGYNKISNGGWPKDAMMAITGFLGDELKFVIVPPLNRAQAMELLGARVARALKLKKFVTLWSTAESDNRTAIGKLMGVPIAQDGLVDDHVYTVVSMSQAGHGGWTVNLRNPWGTNLNVGEGKDSKSPLISVSLQTLVDTGGLQSFRVSDYRLR